MATALSPERDEARETLLSVLCTKDNWTPQETALYTSIAFREDGVGFLKFSNDQPGALLACEFSWEFGEPTTSQMLVDTRQKDLEDSLRTRQLGRFRIDVTLRDCQPREEFGCSKEMDIKEAISRRLKETAFEEESFFVRLEVGNFSPDSDTSLPGSEQYGRTRWALRLAFDRSPAPSREKWHDGFQGMLEAMNLESETNWFSRKLDGSWTGM
ncbi:hypothetical protein KVR01_000293 [Diaporthe batatas]|uniref:uncharacterized protein n=1 Tax=Diaporthe batatas TaxID=748121 RepID=UPI001D056092|nr:uncharacterized protein KVR01_000293 [Diaporthe batatas]KAG8169548.1 hypothetical protein KVR01_000293 [Diaporthe batatas]